jgi:uncharacterized Zn finger protein (UPF0148 family)
MYEQQDYGTCNYCGADKVKNPKTGKIFCSDKCWTKAESSSEAKNRSQANETGAKAQDTAAELPADFKKHYTALIKEVALLKDRVKKLEDSAGEQKTY